MKPRKKIILDTIISTLSIWMESLEFKYQSSYEAFTAKNKLQDKRICIDLFTSPSAEYWNLSFNLNVRFHDIEDLLNKYKSYISKKESSKTVTIARSMLDICRADPFKLFSSEDVLKYESEIRKRIEKYAIPYLERYSDINYVRQDFEAGQNQWPMSNPIARCEILLAIFQIQGNQEAFHTSIEQFKDIIRNHGQGYYLNNFCEIVRGILKDHPNMRAI
jgi:hypothetical protein